ncbi:MAG: LysM peptidoglycan-binding domain-containing protein [Chloroflexi bacterium]|nr:LysM peptidoglycan-binding domain-containing protein [Chloroflexota bacterium]
MDMTSRYDEGQHQHSVTGLVALVAGLAVGAVVLHALAGPPHLPSELPSWDLVVITLRGSSVPYEALAYVFTTAAWAVWLWIVVSMALRVVVASADALTHGAAWMAPLRAVSDHITLPVIRKLVDGALVALFMVQLVGRPAPTAAAAPLMPAVAVAAAATPRDSIIVQEEPPASEQDQAQRAAEYTVQPGDTLWSIAERFYGTGYEYPRVVEANTGQLMPDGRRFTQAGVIYPGWVLVIPLPSDAVEEIDGQLVYVVEGGDTLRGIAARLLGAESRWEEIFDLNKGMARLKDGRVLTEPDLIWPGLRLTLPLPNTNITQEHVPEAGDGGMTAVETGDGIAPEGLPSPATPPIAVATPQVMGDPEPTMADGTDSTLPYGAAGLAAAAAVGGAVLLARRRARRSLTEPPVPREPARQPSEDFAEAEFARTFTHHLHGGEIEPATLLAEHAVRFLAEQGVPDVSVLTARHGRNAATLTLSVGLFGQPQVLSVAPDFGARVGGTGSASLTSDRDIALHVSGPKLAGLLTRSGDRGTDSLCLLPLGVLPNRETFYANWHAIGHVLIAGLPGGGTDVILTSVISALAARRQPEDLALWTIASRRTLPSALAKFPHQCGSFVDPDDEAQVELVLQELRAELMERMRRAEQAESWKPGSREAPEILLVLGELSTLPGDSAILDLIGEHGPAHGIRLVAATTEPATLGEEVLSHFSSRLVLQTCDAEESIHLIGRPDAADLGSGELLLRIEGRVAVRAQGFRVAPDHLEELAALMCEAYGIASLTGTSPQAGSDAAASEPPAEAQATEAQDWGFDASLFTLNETGRDSPQPEFSGDAPSDEASGTVVAVEDRPIEVPATSSPEPSAGPQQLNGHQARMTIEPIDSEGSDRPTGSAATVVAGAANGHRAKIDVPQDGHTAVELPAGEQSSPAADSLFQVYCFGDFEVRRGDVVIKPYLAGRSVHRSFELLAFLAIQPEGSVDRERVFAALWPEGGEEGGANRLSVTMSRLREVFKLHVPDLPERAIRLDRNGMCHIDTSLIWSDVHAFVALCRAAPKLPPDQAQSALRQALALYRGDLLTGRATRLYQWADERGEAGLSLRDAYREEYKRATLRLAKILSSEGQALEAVPLLKGLLKAEPTLEDVVRDLFCCYQQLGDLSSLIREERHLREALQEMFYDPRDPKADPSHYPPEPETVALFEEIRRDLEARVATVARDGG